MADPRPTVVPYREDFRPAFEQLNRDWIESYFVLEDADRAVFADPAGAILGPGGQIFFVVEGDTVLGTCCSVTVPLNARSPRWPWIRLPAGAGSETC